MKIDEYISEIESRVGKTSDFFYTYDNDDWPKIGIFGFDNYPSSGRFTYFSYGLHLLNKPEWKAGRPEYFITIDNSNRDFAAFFSFLLSVFCQEKIMSWNTLIGIDDGDAVDGYPYRRLALGIPLYLNWSSYKIDCGTDLPINLGMGYFISNNDFESAMDRGFQYLTDKLDEDENYWWRLKST